LLEWPAETIPLVDQYPLQKGIECDLALQRRFAHELGIEPARRRRLQYGEAMCRGELRQRFRIEEIDVLGIDRFGASAPYEKIAEELGFTPQKVAERIRAWRSKR